MISQHIDVEPENQATQQFLAALSHIRPPKIITPLFAPSTPKPRHSWSKTWLQRNAKRLLYVPVAGTGIFYGLRFSTFMQQLPPAPAWASLLRLGAVAILPHMIPSVLGLIRADASEQGPVTSLKPVTLRWVTRGTSNAYLSLVCAEMAMNLIAADGHTNFRVQIVTDELHSSQHKRVPSHLLIAKQQEMLADYIDLVIVPDGFNTRRGTAKKGRALVYAALRDQSIRFAEEGRVLLSLLLASQAAAIDEIHQCEFIFQAQRFVDNMHHYTEALQSAYLVDNELGDIQTIINLLGQLPNIITNFIQEMTNSPRHVNWQSLEDWVQAVSQEAQLLAQYRFCALSAAIFHLDEESKVTPEVLSGINCFSENSKQNAWRLGQGVIQYADRWNRNNNRRLWRFEDMQARFCQILDSVRPGDDFARFYFQYTSNQVIFGAKGSFLHLGQILEQDNRYNFDGGPETSITEDACLAFNIAAAADTYYRELKAEFSALLNHQQQVDVLIILQAYNLTRVALFSLLQRQQVQLANNLGLMLRSKGLSHAYQSDLDTQLAAYQRQWQLAFQNVEVPHADALVRFFSNRWFRLHRIFQSVLAEVHGHVYRNFLCWQSVKDASWITGTVQEQSPFTLKEFMLQRRRWFSGLMALIKYHRYISRPRRIVFTFALIGWALMQLNTLTLIAPFFTSEYAIHPVLASTLGFMAATYLFIYVLGWQNQIHDSFLHRYGGWLLIPFAQISAINCFESIPCLLALFAPDLNFKVIDKAVGLEDIKYGEHELTRSAEINLRHLEHYMAMLKLIHACYLELFQHQYPQAGAQAPMALEEMIAHVNPSPCADLMDVKLMLAALIRVYQRQSQKSAAQKSKIIETIYCPAYKAYSLPCLLPAAAFPKTPSAELHEMKTSFDRIMP